MIRVIKLDRYIFRTTFLTSIFALLLLIIIETFFTFLTELQSLGNNGYSIEAMLWYLFYDTPSRAYRIFPMALLLGSLIGLGQLSTTNEIVVMRAAGLGKLRIMLGAIFAAFLLSMVAFLIGELLVPVTKKLSQDAQTNTNQIRQGKGFWAIAEGKIIHVQASHQNVLNHLIIYELDDQRLSRFLTVEQAIVEQNTWRLPTSTLHQITPTAIHRTIKAEQRLPAFIEEHTLNALSNNPDVLSTRELWFFIHYLENNGLDAAEYRLAFWNNVFNPFLNLSMIMIALPFIFGHGRQQGLGTKLLIAIMVGLMIYLASRMLGHFILLYNYLPIFGALLPIVLAIGIALLIFKLKS